MGGSKMHYKVSCLGPGFDHVIIVWTPWISALASRVHSPGFDGRLFQTYYHTPGRTVRTGVRVNNIVVAAVDNMIA